MSSRLIEWNLPLKEISENAQKKGKKGNISTLHTWWARRPLNISRVTTFASLIDLPSNKDDRQELIQFLVNLSKFNTEEQTNAKKIIDSKWFPEFPKVLDPFAGGGSIPFEAMKLKCDTYANDLNPVSVFILKALMEWPQKIMNLELDNESIKKNLPKKYSFSLLYYLVKKYAEKVEEIANKEIINYFVPKNTNNTLIPLAYYWIKIFICQNPSCETEIPLMRNFYIANKKSRRIALKPVIKDKKISFKILMDNEIDFDPSKGTITLGKIECLSCHQVCSAIELRKLTLKKRISEKLAYIIFFSKDKPGKIYYNSTKTDEDLFKKAEEKFYDLNNSWSSELPPIPNETIRTPSGQPLESKDDSFFVHLQIVNYGLNQWGDLFNSRQKLVLITFLNAIKSIYPDLVRECIENNYPDVTEVSRIIMGYLGILFNKLMSYNTILNRWISSGESIANLFSRTGLAMVYDYPELNPFTTSYGWKTQVNWVLEILKNNVWKDVIPVKISNYSSKNLPFENEFFDAVITDPPYYDNVPYADLSDFFYVLLKRSVGNLFPELFQDELTPKLDECIVNQTLMRRSDSIDRKDYDRLGIKTKESFNKNLLNAFKEINRVVKSKGIIIVVYAHKSNEGWESIINALIDSGLTVTASWPINTELKNRLRARTSATLASSIYIICRKREKKELAFFNDLTNEIKLKISDKLTQFWESGISGSDFFISAIGPALEIFSQYEKILAYDGSTISSLQLLDFIRSTCAEFSLNKLLQGQNTDKIDKLSLFYLLYRWLYLHSEILYEDARKLALIAGIDLESNWISRDSFILKNGSKITVLDAIERGNSFRKNCLIDSIHLSILLWLKNDINGIKNVISDLKVDRDQFWLLCQVISESLPPNIREKKHLDGLLFIKNRIIFNND